MVKLVTPPETPDSDPFEGTIYRLVRPLAHGGMGQVFLVEHRQLGRQLVAKVLKDELAGDSLLVERFRIEAQSLGKLRHPNVVAIVGFGNTSDKRPFLVTEYLQGQTIAQALASGIMFTVRESIRYARETLSALAAAHELGIIHRDIKPENLFIQQQPDGSTQIKVLDFGVARVIPGVSPGAPQPLAIPTDTGLVFGTPHYMSPEGALGEHVDHRADIYSLGLVLYRMLARRGPFNDDLSGNGIFTAGLTQDPKPPSFFALSRIPPELDDVVLKALQRSPDDRYSSVGEFDAALANVTQFIVEDENDTGEVAIPLTARGHSSDSLLATTSPAARNAVQSHSARANVILFAVIMLATSVLVSIIVMRLGQGTGVP